MELLGVVQRVVRVLRANFAPLVAGSLAYSAFVSIPPLLMLVVVAATVLGQQQLVDQALAMTGKYITPTGRDLFTGALRDSTGRAAASAFSLLFLLWSGLRVFRGLDTAFSLFYDTTGAQTLVKHLRDAVIVGGSLAIALVASVAVGLVSTVFPIIPRGWLLGPILLVVPLIVAFLPIYYVFPDVDVGLREVLPGVVVAAIGWAALQSGFQLYTNYAGGSLVYGVIGAVLLVLTWLYVAAFLLLIGVAVNVVLADRTSAAVAGSPSRRGISPDE